eukprot:CAMPEP_0182424890 /NCGR_PEP_ID=MMETSP1167-20130531/11157_1 /TAXON_ID=2988 /ORGANISM="Mallomonas Sp, Strain CCMP3275" /LENGTH=639 /DNA_ID=CAMNT_0024605045 /DNA_START=297 /DNA_END=2216 /DNA_ORIENTATION=-
MTYREVGNLVRDFASGLKTLNLVPPNNDGISMLGLYMKNCRSWIVAEQSAFTLGAATVPLYDSFRQENIEFILSQTETKTVICSMSELNKLLLAAQSVKSLNTVIVNCDAVPSDMIASATLLAAHVRVISWAEVLSEGQKSNVSVVPSPPPTKSIATFCYTSGTTGIPKGAMLTHENLMVVVTGGLESGIQVNEGDTYLSFLPLPHIFERIVVTALLACGGCVGFYRGDATLIVDDLKALRPTLLCAVPRLLTRICDKVISTGTSAPGIKGVLFRAALQDKLHRLESYGQTSHLLWDPLVFAPIKRTLGFDRLKTVLSGGAPLNANVMSFFRVLLGSGAACHEGYGMTETTGATTMTAPEDLSTGHVGGPFPSLEVRLMDVPEMGYSHTDTEHDGKPCEGRGEICVRGPGVFLGYYKADEETAKALTPDGWLLTGDIGSWTSQGQLVIIDRKKNLFKLAQGEYVAVERVENILSQAALVSQLLVHGESTENCVVAIVVPDEEEAKRWANSHQWTHGQTSQTEAKASDVVAEETKSAEESKELFMAKICTSPEFKDAVLQQMTVIGKERNLAGYEIVKAIHLEPEQWAPQGADGTTGLLTPTLKIRREAARVKYSAIIKQMYESLHVGAQQSASVSHSKL